VERQIAPRGTVLVEECRGCLSHQSINSYEQGKGK